MTEKPPACVSPSLPQIAGMPTSLRLLRAAGFAVCVFIWLVMISWGSMEFRVASTIAVLIGVANPLWGIGGIVLFGPLFLSPTSHHDMMPLVDALALGAVAGTIRLAWWKNADSGPPLRWGLWPVLVIGLLLLAFAASWPALVWLWFEESNIGPDKWIRYTTHAAMDGGETDVSWGLRSLVHWCLGLGLAVAAARHVRREHLVLFLKIGAIGVVLACVAGMFDELSRRLPGTILTLDAIRATNPDPQQYGRFQGTAGHAGWLGEWMLLWGGGLLLFLGSARRSVRIAGVVGLLFVLFCLLLTAARAAWFGVIAMGIVIFLLAGKQFRPSPKALTITLIAGGALVLGAILFGGDAVTSRFDRILRLADRINYFSSGLVMLREYPLGIGLGMHHVQYASWFTDQFHYYQLDYVTSHNHYLHLLIEQGPIMLGLFMLGSLGLIGAGLRAWYTVRMSEPLLPALLVAAIVAMLVDGLAQYFFYIRVIEYGFWIIAGLLVGYAVRVRPPFATGGLTRVVLLALCGIGALVVLRSHVTRELIHERPRPWTYTCSEEGCHWNKWTAKRERFPVEPTANGLRFSLFRLETPALVTLSWPDGHREETILEAGEFRWFFRNFHETYTITDPDDTVRFEPRRWMTIEVDHVYVPAQWEGHPKDPRGLGVFVNHLLHVYHWDERPEDYPFVVE